VHSRVTDQRLNVKRPSITKQSDTQFNDRQATVVFHSHIKRSIRHQQLRKVVPFTFRAAQKVSKTIANLSTESLDAVRVLVYALVKRIRETI
jgi:hypothetical protein